MYDFKTHAELGDAVGEGSGSWGWTHKGREFVAIGQTYGAAFAEVTKKGQLEYVGRLGATNDVSLAGLLMMMGDVLTFVTERDLEGDQESWRHSDHRLRGRGPRHPVLRHEEAAQAVPQEAQNLRPAAGRS
jgi:hypothetical protein